jgi:hypothetical protein
MSEGKFMKKRWRPRGRGWGGIELVLKQISLPVAQIRVIINMQKWTTSKY